MVACGGGENPTPPSPDTRTDLKDFIANKELNLIVMSNTIPDKIELLKAIKDNNPSANDLTVSDFEFKQGTTPSETTATIVGTNGHKGEVVLTYEKDTRTGINGKITSPIVLEKLDTNTASEFLIKLQAKLVTISGLSNIKTTDYDVYKTNTIKQKITDNDITINTSLNIKIVASPTSQNFRGSNQNIVVNFQKKIR